MMFAHAVILTVMVNMLTLVMLTLVCIISHMHTHYIHTHTGRRGGKYIFALVHVLVL